VSFRPVDLAQPVDIDVMMSRLPPERVMKGLFLNDLVRELEPFFQWDQRYFDFGDHPQLHLANMALALARYAHPHLTTREAFQKTSAISYPSLKRTTIGRMLFGMVGSDPTRLLPLASRAYQLSLSHGRAELLSVAGNTATLRFTDVPLGIEGWQTGILHGALEACHSTITLAEVDLQDDYNGLVRIHWKST
jgi:uncharacterized protein (TIGR02265 family)